MRSLLVLLALAACSSTHADRPADPDPRAAAPAAAAPTTAEPVAPKLAASFDTALLCTDVDDTGRKLGSREFGTTESDPPAPSRVGAVTYRFGNEPRILVAGMHAALKDLGDVSFAGTRIAADASLDDLAGLAMAGCSPIQHNEGGNVIECVAGDVTVTFAVGSIGGAGVEVGAFSSACR